MKSKSDGTRIMYFLGIGTLVIGWISDYWGSRSATVSLSHLAIIILGLTSLIDRLSRRVDRLEKIQSDRDKDLIALEPAPHDRILNIKKEPSGSETSV